MNKLKLFEEQEVSIYKVQKDLGYENNRLYRYAEKKRKIKNMQIDMILNLAVYFKMTPDTLIKKMEDYLENDGKKRNDNKRKKCNRS